MTTGFRTFDVSFLIDATEGNVVVTANDVEQALKAARLKLAMRFATDIEITGVRRQGLVQASAFEQRVDFSDPAAILLQVAKTMHADLTLTLDGDTPESTAFFLSTLCLVDNGHVLPDELAKDLERLLDETSICWRWGIDRYDESRPSLDPLACISDIAGELADTWRPTPVVLTDRDVCELQHGYRGPIDFDEAVDFAGNSMAYAYILLAGAHSLPLHVAGSLCELIGAADVFGRSKLPRNKTDDEWIDWRQFGFGLLHRPREPFKELLRDFAIEMRSKSGSAAVSTAYHHVYRSLRSSLKHSDFDCVRAIFRELSIEELPLAPGDNVFGPIEHRRWHTIASASKEFGINMSALGNMLEGVGIISKYDYRVSPNGTIIPEAVMTNFVRRLSSSLDKAQMCRLLGVKAPIFDRFLDLKLLAPSGLRRSFNDHTPLFDPEDAESLIRRLRGDATISQAPRGSVDILKLRSAAGCTLAEIVDLLFSRRLKRVYFDDARSGIAAIRVDPAEVREIMASRALNVIDIPFGLPKLRCLSNLAIWRLVDDGHLTSVDIPHHIYGTPYSVVTAWSVELFEERYAPLAELASRLFTDARRLRRELEEEGVTPFLNDPHPENTLYEVAEVARLKIGKGLL